MAYQFLDGLHSHIPAALLLFLMVVRLVALSNFLLTNFSHQLAVHMTSRLISGRQRFPEDVAHVVEELCSAEKD